jgi:hypothetical protein
MIVERMVEEGHWIPPEPWMNLELGIKTMLKAWAYGLTNDWPQERMDMLVEWMTQAKELTKLAEPPPAPPMPGDQMAQPGMPGMPPPGMPPGMPPGPAGPPMPPGGAPVAPAPAMM